MTEKKDSSRVFLMLWIITLIGTCLFWYRGYQISEQKAQSEFQTLNTMLAYAQCVLANTENEEQWDEGVLIYSLYPTDIYNVKNEGDNLAIVTMLRDLRLVNSDHPHRDEVIQKLKELRVSRDSIGRVFTVVEGDAEAISDLCRIP